MRKPFPHRQSATWWLGNPAYRRYMLREATALPLFLYSLLLVYGVYQLAQGEAAFLHWLALLRTPPIIALHVLALLAALLHAWTWIALVPKILVLDRPPLAISGRVIKRAHQLAALLGFIGLLALAQLALQHGGG